MNKNKTFKGRLNFSKAELNSSLAIGVAGVSMPIPENANYKAEYSSQKDWLNFGSLWSSINDPKYYAGTKAEDVMPKKEDFVEAPFRLLSATTVGAGTWKATDFSNAGVLRQAMHKLEGKPLYKDHETDLDNWVGLVTAVKWSESFMDNSGVKVPAGIDGIVAIDAKTNPKTARGVLMGSIFSNSVTVEFEWQMSHHFESEWDFYEKVGQIGSDGMMIRRIVTSISDFHESSLVWLGADPFAKAHSQDGGLKHIDTSSIYEYSKQSFGKDLKTFQDEEEKTRETLKNNKKYVINLGIDENILSLSQHKSTGGNSKNNNSSDMDKKFLLAFVATFGKQLNLADGAEPTTDEMIGYMKQLSFVSADEQKEIDNKVALAKKVEGIALTVSKEVDEKTTTVDMEQFLKTHTFVGAEELSTLKQEAGKVETLTKEKQALEKDANVGKQFVQMKKDEAVRLYKLSVGEENADEAVLNLFKKAENEEIDGLLKQYTKSATAKFSGTCADCGSKNFKFQSSVTADDNGEEEVETTEMVTSTDLYSKYAKSGIHIGRSREQQ